MPGAAREQRKICKGSPPGGKGAGWHASSPRRRSCAQAAILSPAGCLRCLIWAGRWQHDRVVRSTHGVNCTGSCSWEVFVKDGIVTWEMPQTDYPCLDGGLPAYEPRGCARGNSFSWYLYSPLRVKYPYIRGVLLDLWRRAKSLHADPVEAWAFIVEDESGRQSYQQARGKGGAPADQLGRGTGDCGGFHHLHDQEVRAGPGDRLFPHPCHVHGEFCRRLPLFAASGWSKLEFLRLVLRSAQRFPEVWGEQTDVAESADWFNSKYIVAMGSNVSLTRTPDFHFVAEARHNGAKLVVLSPDFSQVSRYADWWIPAHAGQDGTFWMAVNHVILQEFHADRPTPYFLDYLRRYTDAPFLVTLEKQDDGYAAGRLLRAGRLARYREVENGEWKFLVLDKTTGEPRMPQGSLGFRWQKAKGQWNLKMQDGLDGLELDPLLTFREEHDAVLPVGFVDFAGKRSFQRGVPVRYIETDAGRLPVTTIYDLLMAQFGVGRGLPGEYPRSYDDEEAPYTPAWQEKFTGIGRQTVLQFAREWALLLVVRGYPEK